MSLKINVGFTQKVGQPDYGSIGASCNIECDLDSKLLFQDPEAFRNQVQGIYEACTRSVHDELAKHARGSNGNGRRSGADANGNGNGQNGTHTNGMETAMGTGAATGMVPTTREPPRTARRGQRSQAQVRDSVGHRPAAGIRSDPFAAGAFPPAICPPTCRSSRRAT